MGVVIPRVRVTVCCCFALALAAPLRSARIEKADGTTWFGPVLRRPIKMVPALPGA